MYLILLFSIPPMQLLQIERKNMFINMDRETYNVGEKIKYFRLQKHYSVNKLATMAGISQSFLRDVELGNRNITVNNLSYVCDALDISLSDFFNDNLTSKIANEPVLAKLYQLTDNQRAALTAFLDTIIP